MHVAVRTDDRELAKSLQSDLGDLVSRLDEKGYKTATWTPGQRIDSGHGLDHAATPGTEGRFSGGQDGQNQQGGRDSHRRQRAQWESAAEQKFHLEQQEAEANDDRSN
jgi:hypothetical protein